MQFYRERLVEVAKNIPPLDPRVGRSQENTLWCNRAWGTRHILHFLRRLVRGGVLCKAEIGHGIISWCVSASSSTADGLVVQYVLVGYTSRSPLQIQLEDTLRCTDAGAGVVCNSANGQKHHSSRTCVGCGVPGACLFWLRCKIFGNVSANYFFETGA